MWALPNIVALNRQAALNARKLTNAARTGLLNRKPVKCDDCDENAVSVQPWYDIFSDKPKGLIAACEEHDHGIPEGYFFCDSCERLMIENYTWELYYHINANTSEQVCLNCYAKEYVPNPAKWLPLTDETIQRVSVETLRSAPHLIAVSGPVPKGLKFIGNVEFDSETGGRLRSTSHADATPDYTVAEIKKLLQEAKRRGKTEAILILDAAYQFSASIGVYVRTAKSKAAAA